METEARPAFPSTSHSRNADLICLRRGFPCSPAAHGANVVMVRRPTVKVAPSHSAEQLSADLQVRAAQLTDKNKLLLLSAPQSHAERKAQRDPSQPCASSAQLSGTFPFPNPSSGGDVRGRPNTRGCRRQRQRVICKHCRRRLLTR